MVFSWGLPVQARGLTIYDKVVCQIRSFRLTGGNCGGLSSIAPGKRPGLPSDCAAWKRVEDYHHCLTYSLSIKEMDYFLENIDFDAKKPILQKQFKKIFQQLIEKRKGK